MENEKTIEVLNTLITINNDRIEGYETAAKETSEQELKTLFAQFSATSLKCKQQLIIEVAKLGGKHEEGTLLSGKFFRVWMDVKAALTGKDRKAILNSCEFGEDAAIDTYNKELTKNLKDLPSDIHVLLNAQRELIKADRENIKSLRDALIEA